MSVLVLYMHKDAVMTILTSTNGRVICARVKLVQYRSWKLIFSEQQHTIFKQIPLLYTFSINVVVTPIWKKNFHI